VTNPQTIDTVYDPVFETEHKLPMHWEICEACRGSGTESVIPGAITSATLDEWYGADSEERYEFLEEYTKPDGMYSRGCSAEGCKDGKVWAPDVSMMSGSLRVFLDDARQEIWDDNAIQAAEIAAGC
jgi:hypothetical protein